MSPTESSITGQHKTALIHELINGLIVLAVVAAATIVDLISAGNLPQDLLGFVYGGAITYAGGRASTLRTVSTRATDANGSQT